MGEGTTADREVERLMGEVREQQQLLERVQHEIKAARIHGSAERGLVTVTMNGGGRFTAVTIDDDAVRLLKPSVLGDVVLEAIHDAMGQLAALIQERFGPLMEDPTALQSAVTYWKPEDAQRHER